MNTAHLALWENIRADLAAMEPAGVKPGIPADWTEMPH